VAISHTRGFEVVRLPLDATDLWSQMIRVSTSLSGTSLDILNEDLKVIRLILDDLKVPVRWRGGTSNIRILAA
jgi:hypothetical protein